MKLTALLPMKGHSERIPEKNIRDFNGNPLYHCIIKTLSNTDYIQSIVINTDSNKIAKDALMHFPRVNIHSRPIEIQGDLVSMNTIIAYDLSILGGEHFLQTHSTNPLLTTKTLEKAIRFYFNNLDKYDSLFSVTPLYTRLYNESGEPVNHKKNCLLRTQDLPPVYEENSNFYIFSKNSFISANNNRIGLNPKMFPMSKLESIDIDEKSDFQMAEYFYKDFRHDF
ncbi:acylneuraminate cytidylyltransferase [Candidatus Magnetomorum sp. HK-1]|nr:acylneuraminate cytidylyltransferase [Candidatus Magnetomorum sp. HK-1]